MLAMTVLWIAMPVSTCLRAMQPMGQHACCHSMAQACNPSAMNPNSSCCQVHPQNPATTPVFSYFSEHAQQLAFVSHPARLPVPARTSALHENAFAPPPSILSSAGASILRI